MKKSYDAKDLRKIYINRSSIEIWNNMYIKLGSIYR